MKNIILILSTIAALILINGCGEKTTEETIPGGSMDLSYKFRKGQEFYVLLDWNQASAGTDSLGKVKNDTVKMVTTFKYVVDYVDENGTADISVTYDHMRMGNFDSDDSTQRNTREGMMYASMMNYVLKTKIDKKGKVLELSGGDNFYTFGQPDSLVDDNACLKGDLTQFFTILPAKPVKKGDGWEDSFTIDFGFPGIFKNKYTFMGVEDSVATIDIKSKISPNENGKTVFPGGFVLHQLFSGERTESIKFDLRKGIIQSSSYFDKYSGTATGKSNGKRMVINLKIDLHKDFSVSSN